MNLALYTRVSSDSQVDGDSLPEQERAGRAWAASHGHGVVAVFTDAGLSGALPVADRPGLAAAMEALSVGVVDGLVVRDLDRLARELTVQEAVLAQIWMRADTRVFTFHGEVLRDDPDDPMRTAMRQMAGVFAQLEKSTIVKRLRDARRAKARDGEHANGPAPYGWRTTDGELHPVPDEQTALSLIRTLRTEGLSQTEIATVLNDRRLPARGGGVWTQPVVSRILRRDAARSPERVTYEATRLAQ